MGCQVCLGPNYCAIFQSVVLQALMRAVNSINHSHEAVPLVNVEKVGKTGKFLSEYHFSLSWQKVSACSRIAVI